jgi:hypothetical protein
MLHLRAAILRDALPLLVSYVSGRDVELAPRPVDIDVGAADLLPFARELRARYVLSCMSQLRTVLRAVELRPAVTTRLERAESRGVVRGRLDVPAYLSRRARNRSLPRNYPLIVTAADSATPENRLLRSMLAAVDQELRTPAFPRASAEARITERERRWLRATLSRDPWRDVPTSADLRRLERATQERIRRRQTGNDGAYRALLAWLQVWRFEPGARSLEDVVSAMMLFLGHESFWERVFEVWCLAVVYDALAALGFTTVTDFPLHRSRAGALRTVTAGSRTLEVWFQRSKPMGTGRWIDASAQLLRGIPDIAVTEPGRPPLLVDAKLRGLTFATVNRSDEIYKMLGYAEQFPDVGSAGLHGLLIFPGETTSSQRWTRGPDGDLELLFAAVDDPDSRSRAAASIQRWLDA